MKQSICRFQTHGILFRAASLALTILALAAAACSANQIDKNRSEVLKQYETLVRWSQWDAAAAFIAPEYLEQHPISRLELDRLRLFRVTQYTLRSARPENDGMTMRQSVEIRLFNTNQAVERTIMDEQEWRYDQVSKSWRLYSGLPDPTKR
jgi:hypothetical protein